MTSDAILRIFLARHLSTLVYYPVIIILVPNQYIAFLKIPNIVISIMTSYFKTSTEIYLVVVQFLKKQTKPVLLVLTLLLILFPLLVELPDVENDATWQFRDILG